MNTVMEKKKILDCEANDHLAYVSMCASIYNKDIAVIKISQQDSTLIGFPQRNLAFPIWIAAAASECVLYLTNPKPLSRCTLTSSIVPAPRAWK